MKKKFFILFLILKKYFHIFVLYCTQVQIANASFLKHTLAWTVTQISMTVVWVRQLRQVVGPSRQNKQLGKEARRGSWVVKQTVQYRYPGLVTRTASKKNYLGLVARAGSWVQKLEKVAMTGSRVLKLEPVALTGSQVQQKEQVSMTGSRVLKLKHSGSNDRQPVQKLEQVAMTGSQINKQGWIAGARGKSQELDQVAGLGKWEKYLFLQMSQVTWSGSWVRQIGQLAGQSYGQVAGARSKRKELGKQSQVRQLDQVAGSGSWIK